MTGAALDLDPSRLNGGGREFPMTGEDFARIAAIIRADSGINLTEAKSSLVYSRLAKRLRALSLASFKDYIALIVSDAGADERRRALTALTTNVTHFFREAHHFETLEQEALPAIIERVRRGGRARIWSAGCSIGLEPYSIAMSVLNVAPDAEDLDIRILATDIDPQVIAEASNGVYPDRLVQPVPTALRTRFLERCGADEWRVTPALRRLIAFKELNLLRPWPIKGPFDALFCRNVVIYFDEETQKPLWSRFASLLAPGGWLFIGHSERLNGPAVSAFENKGVTTYRKRADGVPRELERE